MAVDNCKKCNRVFQRTDNPLCPECQRDLQITISTVYRFIQDNPELPLTDIALRCDIPYKDLEKLFLAGKLGAATDLVIYDCQRCRVPTTAVQRRGRVCHVCAEKMETGGKITPEDKALRAQKEQADRPTQPENHSGKPLFGVRSEPAVLREKALTDRSQGTQHYGFER